MKKKNVKLEFMSNEEYEEELRWASNMEYRLAKKSEFPCIWIKVSRWYRREEK